MTKNQMFTLGKNGLEPLDERPILKLYSRVYSFAYAMNDLGEFAIISEPNEHGQQTAVGMTKYNAGFIKVDQHSRPISKKFGIGTYYDDLKPDFLFSEKEVKEAIKRGEEADKQREKKEEEKRQASAKLSQELKKEYHFLKENPQSYKEERANLVKFLQHHFPAVKFRIKKSGYSTIYVIWTDGATEDQVNKLAYVWQPYGSDESGDFWDHKPNEFSSLFGGFKFMFLTREPSPETETILKARRDKYGEGHEDKQRGQRESYEAFNSTDLTGKKAIDIFYCEEVHKWKLKTEDLETAPAPKVETVSAEGLTLLEYSAKAVAVFGDTKPIKDQLKQLGGRFNPRLTHPESGQRCAGWIFSKTKTESLKTLLGC